MICAFEQVTDDDIVVDVADSFDEIAEIEIVACDDLGLDVEQFHVEEFDTEVVPADFVFGALVI